MARVQPPDHPLGARNHPGLLRGYWQGIGFCEPIAILNENGVGVAGAPPPFLVLGNFCLLGTSTNSKLAVAGGHPRPGFWGIFVC